MIPIAAITIDDGMIALIKWALGGFFSLGLAAIGFAGKGLMEILKNSRDTTAALTEAAGAMTQVTASQKEMAESCRSLAEEVGKLPRCMYSHQQLQYPQPNLPHPSTASLNVQPRV